MLSADEAGVPTLGAHALSRQDQIAPTDAPADAPAGGDAPQAEPASGDPPAWLKGVPEKFHAATPEEALAKVTKSYTEVESKLGQSQTKLQELERPNLEVPEVESAQAAFGKVIGDVLENEKIDWQGMRQRYFEYQNLTSSDLSRLEQAGLNPAVFEDALMGERTRVLLDHEDKQRAEAEAQQKAQAAATPAQRTLTPEETKGLVQEFAGGDMNTFAQMAQWGEQNLGQSSMEGIQAAINTGNPQVAQAALRGLHTAYTASQGREQPLQVVGGRAPASNLGPVDHQEAQKIFNDPRYHKIDLASRQWRAQQEAREWRV